MGTKKLGYPRFRDPEYEMIVKFFAKASSSPPFIHCSGAPSCGKSLTVKNVLHDLEVPYAWFDCIQACKNQRIVFEDILTSLRRYNVGKRAKSNYVRGRCDNPSSFVEQLSSLIEKRRWSLKTVCIVLKNSDKLRNISNLLNFFYQLNEFVVDGSICVISISNIPMFRPAPRLIWRIHFKNYIQDEMVEILLRFFPQGYKEETMSQYCSLILSLLYPLCHDFNEIRLMAEKLFPKYMDPVAKKECSETDSRFLYTKFRAVFHESPLLFYLHYQEEEDELTKLRSEESEIESCMKSLNIGEEKPSNTAFLDMPRRLKFLLIAGYLASYNPPTSDKRFFNKGGKDKRRNTIHNVAQDRSSAHVLGPKIFAMERLLCIFHFITEADGIKSHPVNILSQITTLVSSGLLSLASASGNLETPKFRCNTTLEMTRIVARTVDFDLMSHLFDFSHA